jgi:UDP-glucose 4-epimerase
VKALVTGAAGFIGSRLCARLVVDGHTVVGLDDLSDGDRSNLDDVGDLELIEADVRDADAVMRAASGCDVIFHQGAKRSVPRSIAQPELTLSVNVLGTGNVLAAARAVGARVVSASSSSVYGDQPTFPLTEDMPPRPRSPYAASKRAGEILCETWSRAFGVPTVSLRYFNVYGPYQSPESQYAAVIPLFVRACLDGASPTIHGDGEQSRDFTYIDDVVAANLLAAHMPEEGWGSALNIGGGSEPTTINEILRIVSDELGVDPEPIHEPPREGDVRMTQADISAARRLIGYDPQTDIRSGLSRTVDWFGAEAPV